MTHTAKPVSPLRQRMLEDMRLRKLSPKTQTGYVRHVKEFNWFLGRAPDTLLLRRPGTIAGTNGCLSTIQVYEIFCDEARLPGP